MQSFASRMIRGGRIGLATTALISSASFASTAWGQAPPNLPQGQAPNAPPPPPTEPQRTTPTTPPPPDVARAPGTVSAAPGSGTLSAEQVGARAAQTSYQARAATETLASASARSEGSWANFVPRIGLTARYTRLSNFTPPSIGGGGSLVGTTAPPGPIVVPNTSPGAPAGTFVTTAPLAGVDFSFPLVLDNYLLQATIAVPISDYFLKISQSYTASTNLEEAARFDVTAARAKSYADGKVAYYTWLRAREAKTVADQSLAVAQAHAKDAQNQFAVGNASRADVLRAETAVAAAELTVERAKSGIIISEKQIRIAMHAGDDERLEPGETLDSAPPAFSGNVKSLVSEAVTQRAELKSLEKNAEAQKKLATAARNGRYPSLSGFGDATYANPNPRRFPQTSEWFPTWSVGAQITWSPNDILTAGPQAADAEARANALEAQRQTAKDGIELEVTQAYTAVLEADTSIATTKRQLDSATEGYRVARELFNAGRGTSTTLIDAENALAAARFDHLNARADARIARIRLEHALGRDTKTGTTGGSGNTGN